MSDKKKVPNTSSKSSSTTSSNKKPPARVKNNSKTSTSSSSKSTSGGALMDDIKNLAVPFAILLAKQGLDQHFEKEKSVSVSSSKATKPKVIASAKRRGTMAGGECTAGCDSAGVNASLTGGSPRRRESNVLQQRFDNIAKEIELFLKKY